MRTEVSAALALALGQPVEGRKLPWASVFGIARRERCAALAWLRSAPAIRQAAPREVAAAWRAEAMSAVSLADFWEQLLGETVSVLEARGVDAVVLKGLPLSRRLYGCKEARPCSDIDLYIPPFQREAAHHALVAAGWAWRAGVAPHEGGYRLARSGRLAVLEVHSALLDDALVAHLPFRPPGSEQVRVGEATVAAHGDDQLAAFLATHLAKHARPPLLWYVDFSEHWASLTDEGRARARAAAHAARAHRYLDWAVACTSQISSAAAGDAAALQRLGFTDRGRVDSHNAARVARLAATPLDAFRVIAGWLVPHNIRGDRTAFHELSRLRVSRALRHAFGSRRRDADRPVAADPALNQPRSLVVDTEEFNSLVADLARRGARFTIRARGNSMRPALTDGMVVCLTPRGQSPVAVGDVVLAMTAAGSYMIHRVERAADGWVQTRGDGNVRADEPISLDSVVAIAEGVVIEGARVPIPNPRFARARRRLGAALRRGWASPRAPQLRRSAPVAGHDRANGG